MTIDQAGPGQPSGQETDRLPMPEIGRPGVDDIPELLELWQLQYDDHHTNYPGQYAPFTDELRGRIEAHLHDVVADEETHCFVARENGHLVGFADFGVEEDSYFDAAVPSYGVIKEVFVREEARERGISPKLVAQARDYLVNERGMTQVWIQYAANNGPARASYAKEGFVPAQEIAKYTKPEQG